MAKESRLRRKDWQDKQLSELSLRIAHNIKTFREKNGTMKGKKWQAMPQQTLASKAGISITTVNDIEMGKAKNLKLATVVALAKALGIKDPVDLLSKQ